MDHHRMPAAFFLALVFGATWVSTLSAQNRRAEADFQVGQRFPGFAFPSLESDQPMSLVDFRGQKTLLHIFASW
jgi:hypothetical protein